MLTADPLDETLSELAKRSAEGIPSGEGRRTLKYIVSCHEMPYALPHQGVQVVVLSRVLSMWGLRGGGSRLLAAGFVHDSVSSLEVRDDNGSSTRATIVDGAFLLGVETEDDSAAKRYRRLIAELEDGNTVECTLPIDVDGPSDLGCRYE